MLVFKKAIFAGLFALSSSFPISAEKLHVYFLGNSLTGSLTPDRVHQLFQQREVDFQFGIQLSGGKSLIRHLNYKKEPNQNWVCWETSIPKGNTFVPNDPYLKGQTYRFGFYESGLTKFKWDAVVFQPYGSNLHDDLIAIKAFTDMTLKAGQCQQFYLYSTWPKRQKVKNGEGAFHVNNLDYAAAWEAKYTASSEDTDKQSMNNISSRDYFEKLIQLLNAHYKDQIPAFRIIPAGEVLWTLDQKIKKGELPGLQKLIDAKSKLLAGLDADTSAKDGVNLLYADPIHLNPIPHKESTLGIFVSGSTVYSSLHGKSPEGLSASIYSLDDRSDAELIKAIQTTIWDVVSHHPHSGIKK